MKDFVSNDSKSKGLMKQWGPARISWLIALLGLTSCSSISEENDGEKQAVAGWCEVRPPAGAALKPELEWKWEGSPIAPAHNQVMMTPVVVDVSGDGIPDVIFNTFAGVNYHEDGVMRAVSGDTGLDLWAVTAGSQRVSPGASIAAGDIDNDGLVELCTISSGGDGIICFENTGALKFQAAFPVTNPPATHPYNGISLADLEGDGSIELISGRFVFSSTGAVKWTGSGSYPSGQRRAGEG